MHMPDGSPKAGESGAGLFASITQARVRRAGDTWRTLWVTPLALALHGLVLGGLVTLWQGAARPIRASAADDTALVLRLMASPPPPAPARAAEPARSTTARRPRPFTPAV
ncbi:hypothetical protein LZ198_19475, partial [Myxococcus sp. K15C18031901]|nr:hypothetical protein [Myxococcus dinghuensis]